MTDIHQPAQEKPETSHSGIASYVIGFVLAITLTLLAYFIVVNHLATGFTLLATLLGLAAVQLLVQLVFFLHLGRDKNSRWNVASFYFMLMVLVIFVGGSLWIMSNLNYNMMMSPEEMNKFMLDESNRGF
jgi:cytochrome o ubiquinol oxidase operon protein cyoD